MPSASRDIVISNKLGLHARPAMQFVELATTFASDIRVTSVPDAPGADSSEPMDADGKSVMQMLILAAAEGTPLRICATGKDAQAAVESLAALVESRFGEEE